jgi:myo-inositol-1(or 4)-monophosphatase
VTEPLLSAALIDELEEVAQEVASGAADVLREYSDRPLEQVTTKSSPTDLVSEADRASEAFIVSRLRQARPSDSVHSEEGTSHEGTSGISWVADPLDGTTNFFFKVPAYSVSLAARCDGRTIVGVVVDPSRQENWSAAMGRGAWCNGSECHVANARSDVATALVATGFSYSAARRAEQASVLSRLLPAVRDIRRFGSAALDLCWVAGGRFDAFYESGLNDWDWAAGGLICQEAGGELKMLPEQLLLATTPALSGPLAALLTGPLTGPPGST